MKQFFTLAVAMLVLATGAFAQQKRIALVIGNSSYQNGGILKNPVNDADLIASTLEGMGFEVIKETNADLRTMQYAAANFKLQIANYDVALFYYAGHGIQIDGENYLVPTDAKMENREMAKYEAFNIQDINEAFMANSKKTNIMILDACRDNPFRSWERGSSRGFKKVNNSIGTIIGFATQPGETASDGEGENGLYTQKLVEQMKKPQSIESVFKQTRIAVNQASGGKQVPQEWSSLMGDFYFTKKDDTENNNNKNDLPNVFTDSRDGKTYKIVEIGNQVWMAENLAYKASSGCWAYDNDQSNVNKYGYLYNFETAQNVCPNGYHLPSDKDWGELAEYINNADGSFTKSGDYWEDMGKLLKATSGWNSNGNGTDNYGFSALPGGYRFNRGSFFHAGDNGYWWSSTSKSSAAAWYRSLNFTFDYFYRDYNSRESGFSVRCVGN